TIKTETTRAYLVDQEGNVIDPNMVTDETKRDIYAEIITQLNDNVQLVAGLGPGATHGIRLGTEMGQNFYGSLSLFINSEGDIFVPIGLGFSTDWLEGTELTGSIQANLLNPSSPISGTVFVPLGEDFGVQLGFAGTNIGITGGRVVIGDHVQNFVYIPGDPGLSALISFGQNLQTVFRSSAIVEGLRSDVYEARMGLATVGPGGVVFETGPGREMVDETTRAEIIRERPINQFLRALPLIGAIEGRGGPVAQGNWDKRYKDYTTGTLIPYAERMTNRVGLPIFDLGHLGGTELETVFYTLHSSYSILSRVAEREGRTGENTPPELIEARTALENFEQAAAADLNEMFRAGGMQFYEGELERYGISPVSPTVYLDVANARFNEDFDNMGRWFNQTQNPEAVAPENLITPNNPIV
ncbi:MAG: hypothetical protein KAT35_03825, partial [Candidatus Aenigmarchaeota archaeon]|nr:hypothetical protein [Candidatus Aenigmarchaeota archaeon]